MHVFGIEPVDSALPSGIPSLPKTPEHLALEEKVKQLEKQVQELEKQLSLPSNVYNEMNSLLTPSLSLYHGPNDITNFDT